MAFLATIDTSPRPESMKFPVFSSRRHQSVRESWSVLFTYCEGKDDVG